MDDDSFIHSKIGFDVFARMASEDFKYVYRQLAGDRPSDWFSEMWDQYLVDRKLVFSFSLFVSLSLCLCLFSVTSSLRLFLVSLSLCLFVCVCVCVAYPGDIPSGWFS